MGEGIHRPNVGGPKGATLDTSNPYVAVAGVVATAVTVLGAVKIIADTYAKLKGVKN